MLPRLRARARPRAARRIIVALAGLLTLPLAAACEPEVGSPCGAKEFVDGRVIQESGKNDLVRDLGFDCEQGLCASVDGSRPFCTIKCETDLDCNAEGFVCGPLVRFGRLACSDWTSENDCVKPDGTASDHLTRYCVAKRDVIEKRDCDFGRGEDAERCAELRERAEGGGQ